MIPAPFRYSGKPYFSVILLHLGVGRAHQTVNDSGRLADRHDDASKQDRLPGFVDELTVMGEGNLHLQDLSQIGQRLSDKGVLGRVKDGSADKSGAAVAGKGL